MVAIKSCSNTGIFRVRLPGAIRKLSIPVLQKFWYWGIFYIRTFGQNSNFWSKMYVLSYYRNLEKVGDFSLEIFNRTPEFPTLIFR